MERIIAVAVQIVEEEGAEALSMRSLAQRLGSGTATLYRHFGGRAALVAHVVDQMFAGVDPIPKDLAASGWEPACRAIARTMFDTLSRHRRVARLLMEQVPLGPHAMALREQCLAVLLGNGFSPRTAARAYATLARYVLGFAVQLDDDPGRGEDTAAAVFGKVDPASFPATALVASSLPTPLEDEFAFGLDLLLAGLRESRETR
ncbi:TetR/AcrR family transcriptional regulator [Glycomyces sp. NPDC049804]|uniref:TetR/AcrR family transcriptional regulator n=1 Tax=Glycomyces sp. NPDC049804 TaxID=3154363 RepID=UPI0034400EFC